MCYITRRAVTNGNRGHNGGGKYGASNDFVVAKIMRLRLVSVSGKSVTFATRQIAPPPSLASVPRSDMAIISRHEHETASCTA